ncbi:hypothetical protein [Streptomyces sp. SID2888]|uniref:hypothetical protein n=1 Tax=Streptomyces sp. SID2888 TaxID=2690256 RepID=UPI0013686363|nr:hypothetical protein [Streptomyces sp. SID2888]
MKSSDAVLMLKITILAMVVGMASWIIMFARRRTWWDTWSFSRPLISNMRVSSGGLTNGRMGTLDSLRNWRSKFWFQGWALKVAGLGLAMSMTWTFLYLSNYFIGLSAPLVIAPLATYGGIVLFNRGRRLGLSERRLQAQVIRSPSELSAGSYVLYLRPFNEDRRRAVVEPAPASPTPDGLMRIFLFGGSEEEQLADAVRPVGQMVAVGIPGESIPHAGAVRMYLPPDDWKGPVGQLIERARLVVILLGSTPGTIWEIVEAMCTLPPQRLILLVPFQMKSEEYERLRKAVVRELKVRRRLKRNSTLKGALPTLPCRPQRDPDAPEIGFIHFAEGWVTQSSCEVDFGNSSPFENFFSSLIGGMRVPFQELASYEERTGRHHK